MRLPTACAGLIWKWCVLGLIKFTVSPGHQHFLSPMSSPDALIAHWSLRLGELVLGIEVEFRRLKGLT